MTDRGHGNGRVLFGKRKIKLREGDSALVFRRNNDLELVHANDTISKMDKNITDAEMAAGLLYLAFASDLPELQDLMGAANYVYQRKADEVRKEMEDGRHIN